MISQAGVAIPQSSFQKLEFGAFGFQFPSGVTSRELELARDLVNIYIDHAVAELKRRETRTAPTVTEKP